MFRTKKREHLPQKKLNFSTRDELNMIINVPKTQDTKTSKHRPRNWILSWFFYNQLYKNTYRRSVKFCSIPNKLRFILIFRLKHVKSQLILFRELHLCATKRKLTTVGGNFVTSICFRNFFMSKKQFSLPSWSKSHGPWRPNLNDDWIKHHQDLKIALLTYEIAHFLKYSVS